MTVWQLLINLQKSHILQRWGKWKSDPESMSGTRSPPKVNHFFQLVGPITTPSFIAWNRLITFAVILLTDRQTDRMNEWHTNTYYITSAWWGIMKYHCSIWIVVQWISATILLLPVLGWRDECQLLYHKWCCVWSSWWNTQSHAACSCIGDIQLDSVIIYFIFYGNTVAIELLTSYILSLTLKINIAAWFVDLHTSTIADIIFC